MFNMRIKNGICSQISGVEIIIVKNRGWNKWTKSSLSMDCFQVSLIVTVAKPLYSDSVWEQEITFCLEADQDTRLPQKKYTVAHWCYIYLQGKMPNQNLHRQQDQVRKMVGKKAHKTTNL